MSVLPSIVRSISKDYILPENPNVIMPTYGEMSTRILAKYSRLNSSMFNHCQVQNALPNRKGKKRLDPHVSYQNHFV